MYDQGFRFCRRQWFRRVSFENFMEIAQALCDIKKPVHANVITFEDYACYTVMKNSFWNEFDNAALRGRKTHQRYRFTREMWDRALFVTLKITDFGGNAPFVIFLSCDRAERPKELEFYGSNLDNRMHQAVVEKFLPPGRRLFGAPTI